MALRVLTLAELKPDVAAFQECVVAEGSTRRGTWQVDQELERERQASILERRIRELTACARTSCRIVSVPWLIRSWSS